MTKLKSIKSLSNAIVSLSLIAAFCLVANNCSNGYKIVDKEQIQFVDSISNELLSQDNPSVRFKNGTADDSDVTFPPSLSSAFTLSENQAAKWDSSAKLSFVEVETLSYDSNSKIAGLSFFYKSGNNILLVRFCNGKLRAYQTSLKVPLELDYLEKPELNQDLEKTVIEYCKKEVAPQYWFHADNFFITSLRSADGNSVNATIFFTHTTDPLLIDNATHALIQVPDQLIPSAQLFKSNYYAIIPQRQ